MKRSKQVSESPKTATVVAILIALIVLFYSPVTGVPYRGSETFTYHQPDGSTFPVKLFGDEFFAYQRTLGGREVILDEDSDFWCYAKLTKDGRSFVSTGVPVITNQSKSERENLALALEAGASGVNPELPLDVVLAQVRAAQRDAGVDDKGRPLSPVNRDMERPTVGKYTGLCILVDFPDEPGTVAPDEIERFCNQPSGYTGFGNVCSVNEYFWIQSNGRFDYTNRDL